MAKVTLREWHGDAKQRLMTKLVNRTCKNNPNALDRLAVWLLTTKVGVVQDDPELRHQESD